MSRTLFFFYLLVTYVLFQFCWWAYLLIELNRELLTYHYQHIGSGNSILDVSEHSAYTNDLKKRLYMVFGEW